MAEATITASSVAETPTQAIVKASNKTVEITGSTGRRFKLRRLGPLHRMQAFRALGDLSQNFAFLTYSLVALSVVEIDGVAQVPPSSEVQFEAAVDRIGDDWDDVNEALRNMDVAQPSATEAEAAKN